MKLNDITWHYIPPIQYLKSSVILLEGLGIRAVPPTWTIGNVESPRIFLDFDSSPGYPDILLIILLIQQSTKSLYRSFFLPPILAIAPFLPWCMGVTNLCGRINNPPNDLVSFNYLRVPSYSASPDETSMRFRLALLSTSQPHDG